MQNKYNYSQTEQGCDDYEPRQDPCFTFSNALLIFCFISSIYYGLYTSVSNNSRPRRMVSERIFVRLATVERT